MELLVSVRECYLSPSINVTQAMLRYQKPSILPATGLLVSLVVANTVDPCIVATVA